MATPRTKKHFSGGWNEDGQRFILALLPDLNAGATPYQLRTGRKEETS
jgi:hypothetical protein